MQAIDRRDEGPRRESEELQAAWRVVVVDAGRFCIEDQAGGDFRELGDDPIIVIGIPRVRYLIEDKCDADDEREEKRFAAGVLHVADARNVDVDSIHREDAVAARGQTKSNGGLPSNDLFEFSAGLTGLFRGRWQRRKRRPTARAGSKVPATSGSSSHSTKPAHSGASETNELESHRSGFEHESRLLLRGRS
eukprot:6255772-Prymnesium_polylepis.1